MLSNHIIFFLFCFLSFLFSGNTLVLLCFLSFQPLSFFSLPLSPESRSAGAFLRQRLPGLFWYQSFEAARGMLSEVDM